jgi:signal transduction histidine kinase/ActR/RegA family two-component response regulator
LADPPIITNQAASQATACAPWVDPRPPSDPLARIQGDLGRVTSESVRPAALVVGVMFILFAIYNWVAFPASVRVAAVISDLVLVAVGVGMYAALGRIALSQTGCHIAATVLSVGVLGSIVFTALLGVNPLFSFYTATLLIASAGTVLSARWALAIAVIELAGWAVTASVVLNAAQFALNAFVMVAAVAAAFVVHVSRHRARVRIIELRGGDARRELALQQALAEADEARRELDRKVEDRTAALRNELAERERLEQQRERLEEQLRHAQKMEAVGRLAGGIAHDFNNLLTVIRMSHVTMNAPGAAADEVRDAMHDASEATDRAAGLTRDLLAFARKQTLQSASIAVADILGAVERMVRRVAEASIRLEVRIAADVGEVIADRHQLEQVLLNLAINACDAMANRGRLSISADVVELPGADATYHRMPPGSYVRIAVADTGTGMDEATRRSVFEPFFTTKEVGRGTGLGLAVAHGIVVQHGGELHVDSELGKGSTFTVLLPHARSTTPRVTAAVAKPLASLASETVLVVEDEAAVRRAVQRNLVRLGYRVLAAQDGEDALRIAESLDSIDLLLSDVVMPGIDGPEVACRLRARYNDLPVLFVTGYSADRLARSDALGPHDRVLEKPYQLEELARTIRQMLEARRSRAAPEL